MVPGRPVRHEIGIGDQHARRIGVGLEHADRLARLDEQRLVRFEPAQRLDDTVEGVPIARGAADAAVDDELARPLGDVRIEIVHQHAQRGFGEPALGGQLGSVRRADDAHIVEAGGKRHGGFSLVSVVQGASLCVQSSRTLRSARSLVRVGVAQTSSMAPGQLSGHGCGGSII